MKICANCKKLNDDNAIYCSTCSGTKFVPSEAPNLHDNSQVQNKASNRSALDIIKTYGSGRIFKAMTVLLIIIAILDFLIGINTLNNVKNAFVELQENDIHYLDQFFSYLMALMAIYIVLTLGLRISMWIGMRKFRDTSKLCAIDSFETKGLKTIRSTLFIRMIALGVLIVCFAVLLYYSAGLSLDENNPFQEIQSEFSTYIVILMLYLPFMISYSLLLIKTVNSVISTAETGTVSKYVSMYVIVCNFLIAFCSLITIFFLKNFVDIAYSALYILFSIVLLQYKAEISVCKTSFEFDNPDFSDGEVKPL